MAVHSSDSPETDLPADGTPAQPANAAAGPADLRKSDLVDRVVAESGAKKAAVRAVVDATLAEIGKALARGEMLQLPPLGRVKVQKRKAVDGGEVLTLRLRQQAPGSGKPRREREKPE